MENTVSYTETKIQEKLRKIVELYADFLKEKGVENGATGFPLLDICLGADGYISYFAMTDEKEYIVKHTEFRDDEEEEA